MILRYVDDFIVFCNNESNAEIISKTINVKLNEFNLQLNKNKFKNIQDHSALAKQDLLSKLMS